MDKRLKRARTDLHEVSRDFPFAVERTMTPSERIRSFQESILGEELCKMVKSTLFEAGAYRLEHLLVRWLIDSFPPGKA